MIAVVRGAAIIISMASVIGCATIEVCKDGLKEKGKLGRAIIANSIMAFTGLFIMAWM